ncbi:DEAD/DEAH box helicase family protein [Planctomycetota bacterium]|nr:DEAD/DEAH box helicase family protein [Planctomycetota bacterium]
MAKEKATKKKAVKKTSRKKQKPDFHKQTVLFQWALAKFGVKDLDDFKQRFLITPDTPEGMNLQTGNHHFYEAIANALPTVADDNVLQVDRLTEYEQNIQQHTAKMNEARAHHGQPMITWKYHQYLSLLFTEMYLDAFFDDTAVLRDQINGQIKTHNQNNHSVDEVIPFHEAEEPKDQLARLAFWCATGSGKTLLMHIHIMQFRYYHRLAYKGGQWPKLDQIILVTPNDGLTKQHAQEFEYSGFDVATIDDRGEAGALWASHAKRDILILDIHKFREEQGKTTVATEGFEGCNLVLVDEGHRGAGRGEEGKWLFRRDQLAKNGFCIEYSATFKEAVQSDEVMRNRYAKCILFDYAYRSFYRDGYGKDFSILNLEDDNKKQRYLTVATLLFYEQMKVWADSGQKIKPFLLDKPLWVFVGHTVSGGAYVSDVTEVLLFYKEFLANPQDTKEMIADLLKQGYMDSKGRDLLGTRLKHLKRSGDQDKIAIDIYNEILRDVFHAPDGGNLCVQLIKAAEGELAIKVGENEPFGVVNVGDPEGVAKQCEKHGILRLEDDLYRDSLFHGINNDDSPINLLVGSRKFTEGWNSWRVSSIGLMHMGQNEGTQIIQLFGRGVRLRGYKMCLRRSSVLPKKPKTPNNIRQIETLQVFGVKANYMKKFRDWIYEEIPEAQEREYWHLPVVKKLPDTKLRTLAIKDTIDGVKVERGQAFRKLGPIVRVRLPGACVEDAWLRDNPARLNWLPRIHGIQGHDKKISQGIGSVNQMPKQYFQSIHRLLLDYDELLFGLEQFKATRSLDRLHATKDDLVSLFESTTWYVLYAAEDDMSPRKIENRSQWQRMAQQLLNNYAERLYRFEKGCWEAPYIEVVELSEDDPNIISGYDLEATSLDPDEANELGAQIKDLERLLGEDSQSALKNWMCGIGGKWGQAHFNNHLYQPLLYKGKQSKIHISPIALDENEKEFVADLAKWCDSNAEHEVFLLRNQAVTGLGFFQASNFYPDFLLWINVSNVQHLVFVDPKGLHHISVNDPKVLFATQQIPELQSTISKQNKNLHLHAFLVTHTDQNIIKWSMDSQKLTKMQMQELNVLFQNEDKDIYIQQLMSKVMQVACSN